MSGGYKIYSTKDFIRKDAQGEFDFDKSMSFIREVLTAADFHKGHNLLVDLRETETKVRFTDLLTLAIEFAKYKGVFTNKMAILIPDEPERIERAEYFKAILLGSTEFQFEHFTDYEKATDWLFKIEERK